MNPPTPSLNSYSPLTDVVVYNSQPWPAYPVRALLPTDQQLAELLDAETLEALTATTGEPMARSIVIPIATGDLSPQVVTMYHYTEGDQRPYLIITRHALFFGEDGTGMLFPLPEQILAPKRKRADRNKGCRTAKVRMQGVIAILDEAKHRPLKPAEFDLIAQDTYDGIGIHLIPGARSTSHEALPPEWSSSPLPPLRRRSLSTAPSDELLTPPRSPERPAKRARSAKDTPLTTTKPLKTPPKKRPRASPKHLFASPGAWLHGSNVPLADNRDLTNESSTVAPWLDDRQFSDEWPASPSPAQFDPMLSFPALPSDSSLTSTPALETPMWDPSSQPAYAPMATRSNFGSMPPPSTYELMSIQSTLPPLFTPPTPSPENQWPNYTHLAAKVPLAPVQSPAIPTSDWPIEHLGASQTSLLQGQSPAMPVIDWVIPPFATEVLSMPVQTEVIPSRNTLVINQALFDPKTFAFLFTRE